MGERSDYPDGEPCWADVATPDLDGALRFYQAVFGWQFQSTAPESGNYTMALVDGKPVAGIMPPPPGAEATPATWNVYLASSDIEVTAARAAQGGAKIVTGPLDVPGSGHIRRRLRHPRPVPPRRASVTLPLSAATASVPAGHRRRRARARGRPPGHRCVRC